MDTTPDAILEFWFGPLPHTARDVWFRKDPEFDAIIAQQFGDAVAAAISGAFGEWCATAHGALARVIVLDQFPRNIHRDSPLAFAGDARALATAEEVVTRGLDQSLDAFERWFLYLPFEHAETDAAQARSLQLFGALAQETGDRGPLEWAEKHAAIIRRFGRYPHRNAILGRASTPEEIEFLKEPGSRF
jgi:uncharacterized protein (DUF924 family)